MTHIQPHPQATVDGPALPRDIFGRFRYSLQNYRRKVDRRWQDPTTSPVVVVTSPVKPPTSPDDVTTSSDDDIDEGHYDVAANRIILTSDRGGNLPLYEPIMEEPGERYAIDPELEKGLKVLNEYLVRRQSCRLTEVTINNVKNLVARHWFTMIGTNEPSNETVPELNEPRSSALSASLLEFHVDFYESLSKELLSFVANLKDGMGNTALHYSISYGNFDVVSTLLDSKVCHINAVNNAGYTPTMLTALAKLEKAVFIEVVKRLYHMADLNQRATQNGQTALMLAASHDRVELCRALLESGADPNVRDNDGSNALMCAAEHGNITVAKCLLSHPEIDTALTDNDGSTALSIALKAGHKDIGILIYAHQNLIRSSKKSQPTASDNSSSVVNGHKNVPSQSITPYGINGITNSGHVNVGRNTET